MVTDSTNKPNDEPGDESIAQQRQCSVLIPSCDAYSDLWKPFFSLFWRYWPDCPYPVYLGANKQEYSHPLVTTLFAGHGNIWTDRVADQLSQLKTDYVLLILEDFFFRREVVTADVAEALRFIHSVDGHMVRLVPRPPPDSMTQECSFIGRILPGAPYRVSTQAAIWRRSTLLELMRTGESIWEFEVRGSRRSDGQEGYYSASMPLLPYGHHVVERGKWFPHEVVRYAWSDIKCDFKKRGSMGVWPYCRWLLSKSQSLALGLIPWPQRAKLTRQIKRILPWTG